MTDKGGLGIKERKGLCAEGWWVKSRDNSVISWYASGWTWRKIEDNRVGYKKLLVAWSDKRCGKICGWLWYMSE